MRFKTLLLFVTGYAVAEYGLFEQALAAVPADYRFGVTVLTIALVVGSLFDRYYVTPRVRRQVREDA